MTYTKSKAVKKNYARQMKLDRNIMIVTLVNQGWSYRKIEALLERKEMIEKYGKPISFVRVGEIFRIFKDRDIEELRKLREEVE